MNYVFIFAQIIVSDVRNLIFRRAYVAIVDFYLQHEEIRSATDFISDYFQNYGYSFTTNLSSLALCGKILIQRLVAFLLSLSTLQGWIQFLDSLFMKRVMSFVFVTSLAMMFYQYCTATDLTFKVGEPVEIIEEAEPVIGHPVSLSAVGRMLSSVEDASTTPIKGVSVISGMSPAAGEEDPAEAAYPPVSLAAVGKKPSKLASMLGGLTRMRSNSRPTTPSRSRSNSRSNFFFSSSNNITTATDDETSAAAGIAVDMTMMSPLTPESGFFAMMQQNRQQLEEEGDGDTLSESESTGYNSQSEGQASSSQSFLDDANATPDMIMKRSVDNPAILIGWRILVPGYGTGVILSLKKKKFKSTKFVIQFENSSTLPLKLQRSKDKGKVPFQLLKKQR